MEEWKNIIGYEGLYEVSNKGNVRNVRRNTLLKLSKNKYGYIQVYLYKNGIRKGFKVHRLVAQAFILNPDNLPQVNHRDENPGNNNVDNLEWCTHKYNVNYGHRTENAINTRVKNGYADPDFIGFGLNEKEYMKAESFLAKKHCIKPDSIYRSNHLLFLRNRVIDSNAKKEANNG